VAGPSSGWLELAPGPLERALIDARETLRRDDVVSRIWAGDHTLWRPDPREISNRMGWLAAPEVSRALVPRVENAAAVAADRGITRWVLLGMGGSSLAPALFASTLAAEEDRLDGARLSVLDTTVPSAIEAVVAVIDWHRTGAIVASKSGGTIETAALFNLLWARATAALGAGAAGHFLAITDPDTALAHLSGRLGVEAILADPSVGGRYSALTAFGLVPAGLLGLSLSALLDAGATAARACRSDGPLNPGLLLGALLGTAALSGRDKLTLVSDRALAAMPAWIEQLVAESTGKDGRGILPVVDEPRRDPRHYLGDRWFAYLRAAGGGEHDAWLMDVRQAGFPVAVLNVDVTTALG
jgi:glucose-6-phosphate isomerase